MPATDAHVNQIKVAPAVDAIRKYPEHIVGVKVLLTASYANGGRSEYEALRAGLEATAATGVPMVTHHSSSTIPLNPNKPRLEQHELADTDLGCPYSVSQGATRTTWGWGGGGAQEAHKSVDFVSMHYARRHFTLRAAFFCRTDLATGSV